MELYIYCFLALVLLFHGFFAWAVIKKDLSVIDICWGLGFVVIAFVCFFYDGLYSFRQFSILAIVLLWGVRLSWYLYIRNQKKGEDARYKAWREEWGENTNKIAYKRVFWLQTIMLFVISSPIPILYSNKNFDLTFVIVGTSISLLGLVIETIADYQKYKFKLENKGFIQSGLWKFSRHPNYFGEALVWWGLVVMGLPDNGWLLASIGPALLTFSLLKFSGIPMLEQKYIGNEEFEEYKKKTSSFIIWFPKKVRG